MKKAIYILLIFFWAIPSSFAQLKTYTFEEAEKLSKKNPKPFVVFIHTNWCKYCKMMENSTFKNPEIIAILNKKCYFISLDAETKNDIYFNNHIFKFYPSGNNTGIHDLAIHLGTINKQISYPIVCVLNEEKEIIYQNNSFVNAEDFKNILDKLK